MTTVWMFSGQGSQYAGMGRPRYESDQRFRGWIGQCDALIKERVGRSVMEIMGARPGRAQSALTDIELTNPTLFAIQYALGRSLLDAGQRPDLLLGYSLGEVVAITLAGCLDLRDGLEAVVRMAELATATCETGGLVAVLADASFVHCNPELLRDVELAAVNFDESCVISGGDAALRAVRGALRERGVPTQALPVSFAFHSRRIDPMREAFITSLESLRWRPPSLPLLSAHTARAPEAPLVEHLWRVIRHRVSFHATVLGLERRGPHTYADLGPAGSLANAVRYALPPGSTSRTVALLELEAKTHIQDSARAS